MAVAALVMGVIQVQCAAHQAPKPAGVVVSVVMVVIVFHKAKVVSARTVTGGDGQSGLELVRLGQIGRRLEVAFAPGLEREAFARAVAADGLQEVDGARAASVGLPAASVK